MKYEVFSIYDRVSGLYSQPFYSLNHETAVRQFNYQMSQSKMISADCELYYVGTFEDNTGSFIVSNKPEFVCGYEG